MTSSTGPSSTTSPTTQRLRPPADALHNSVARVQLDIPARVVVKVVLVGVVLWVAVLAVLELRTLIIQIAIASFLAIAADPLVRRLQSRGLSRGRAVAVVMLTALAVIGLFVSIFVPPLVEQGDRLIEATPGIVRDVRDSALIEKLDERYDVVDTASDKIADLPGIVSGELGSVFGAIAAGVFGTITILFLTVFLLLGGGQVVRGAVQLLPRIAERRWWTIVQGAYTGIAAYVGGAIIIAFIGGSTMALSALVLGLPYALPLGLWMMLLEIIPLIGATIGAVPGIVVAFVAGGVVDGIIMTIIVIVYQQIENLVIQPRVQGRAAALTPLVVFISVLVGSQLLGVLGALFAVPVAGVVQIFLRQLITDQGSHGMELPSIVEAGAPQAPAVDPGDGLPGITDDPSGPEPISSR